MQEEEEPKTLAPTAQPKKTLLKTEAAAAPTDRELEGFTSVGKGGKSVTVITPENLFARLREVLEARGKKVTSLMLSPFCWPLTNIMRFLLLLKNTDRDEQIAILETLLQNARSAFQRILVLLALIPSRFDINLSMVEHMQIDVWKKVEKEVNLLLQIVEESPEYVIREDAEELDYDDKDIVPAKGETCNIRGSIISLVERLDDEFTKSLQSIDPHTTDYIDRLRDEPSLYAVLVRTQAYLERHDMKEALPRIIIRRLEHLYYKVCWIL